MEKDKYIWAIARIDRDNVDSILGDFKKLGYNVSVKIPCVKILKKKFKNKLHFQNVPLLFDYGFIGIPWDIANSREELQSIKEDIPGILGWLFLSTGEVLYRRRKLKDRFIELYPDIDDEDVEDKFANFYLKKIIKVKTVPYQEVCRLMDICENFSIFSSEDLDRIKIGDFITLRGYPFDNMYAEVLEINDKSKSVTVSISGLGYVREVKVSYDNLYYTIYSGLDESLSNLFLENSYNLSNNED